MYLTAMLVESASGEAGINAFCRLHGPCTWEGAPPDGIPEQNPGELVNQVVGLHPGGNRVRAYLDIIAPDETPTREIQLAIVDFVVAAQNNPLPWAGTIERCTFRFGLEERLLSDWRNQFKTLLAAALTTRRAT